MTEDFKESQFNEAALKMKRIHEAQAEINRVRLNPFNKDVNGNYGFQIGFINIKTLYAEAGSKLTDKEEEEIEKEFVKLERLIAQLYCVMEDFWKYQNELKRNITRKMFILEKMVRKALEEHGYSSPNKEAEAGWD